jgi:hypothetical protein
MSLIKCSLRQVVLVYLLMPYAAQADVSYERLVKVKAVGTIAGYSSQTRVKTQISGDRSRREILPADEMAADLAVAEVRVARLDKDAVFELQPDLRAYREISLEELAEDLAELRDRVDRAAGGQALPIAPDNCEWSEARFRSKKTKEKERIAGKRATRHILSMKQSCTDQDSGQSCELEWIMEPWMASRLPGYEEASEFYQSFADRLGMDYLIPQMPGPSQLLLGMFPNRWESLLDELEEFEGYPLRTVMTLKIGGRACLTDAGTPLEEDSVWAEAADSAYDEALDRTGRETGKAVSDATRDAVGDGVGGAIGSSAVGAATGELLGGLTGMFKKDQGENNSTSRTTTSTLTRGNVTVFQISSEITDWSSRSVPDEQYEIPADWQRQE